MSELRDGGLVLGGRPIVLGPEDGRYLLTETGVLVEGTPSYDTYVGALEFVRKAHKCSGWWLADLLRLGDQRVEWRERLSQAQSLTGLSEQRLKNIRATGAIPPSRRRDGVEFDLHTEVAGLPDEEQAAFLEKAETEGWTRAELRMELRASKRRRVIEGQAHLRGLFRVILADPPYRYGDSGVIAGSAYGRAEAHYATMTIEELCKLPVAAHAMPNAALFLWVPAPLLMEHPGPREIIEAWGFVGKAGFVWDKIYGMPGSYNHVVHEHLLVCTRGDGKPDIQAPQPKSVIYKRRSETHSEKPGEVRQMIRRHWTTGPYLELFAREAVDGWTCFGDDANLWAGQMGEQAVLA